MLENNIDVSECHKNKPGQICTTQVFANKVYVFLQRKIRSLDQKGQWSSLLKLVVGQNLPRRGKKLH